MEKIEILKKLCAHEKVKKANLKEHDGKLIALVEPSHFLDEEDIELKQSIKKYLASHIPYSYLPSEYIFYKELLPDQNLEDKPDASKEENLKKEVFNVHLSRDKILEFLNNMWCAALEIKEVDQKNSFIALGGDSLKAMTIILEIQKKFDVDISFQQFFKFSSLAELKEYILENIA